ncbi:uncharacterized protein LTR77_001952 [Saxophila tyrrhenica]|uniref:Uncharacterized protein n=1 Tax=Saxophila tyrrhenica TaxID=1690608 RepID=A0AAV9PIY7_9PEZI|nr:hypothetical protein LTR77_001952 [Saxophila tyrrhenica]
MPSVRNMALWATTLFAFVNASPTQVRRSSPNGISKRGLGGVIDITCGLWATAIRADADEAIHQVTANGGAINAIKQTCSRLACVGTSGLYVCNDQEEDVLVQLEDLFSPSSQLVQSCVDYYVDNDVAVNTQTPVSAQGFYADPLVNVVISYCDPNDDPYKKPSDYNFDVNCGPNGCNPTCGWEGAEEDPCPFLSKIFASSSAAPSPTATPAP